MRKEMERYLEHFANWRRPLAVFSPGSWQPLMDLYETGEELVILIDLAGVSCEEIELTLSGSVLIVKGERKDHLQGRRRAFHLMEINFGPFERSLELPVNVDSDNVRTSCQDGFLEVVFPKAAETNPKKVIVKAL